MKFELFKDIICQNFQTASLKKFYIVEKQEYSFTFTYLDYYKEFTIPKKDFDFFSVENMGYHMKTVIECEYVKFELAKKNKPIVPEEVEKVIPKRRTRKSKKGETE